MTKVNVTSLSKGEVSVRDASIPFHMSWPAKGTTRQIEEETLSQLMFLPGFDYMIKNGILYIEDMEEKKKLGVEPEDAKEPVNVIVLSDTDKKKYITMYSTEKFKEEVKKLGYEQLCDLAEYAITNQLADFEKSEILKELCGKDIIKGIQLARQNKEE